jgi:hypothetical protein
MNDEQLYRASLRVASSILSGLACALLVGLPLSSNVSSLTLNTLFCILSTIIAIYIERYLQT